MLHNACVSTGPPEPDSATKMIVLNRAEFVRLVREFPLGKNGRNEFKIDCK